MRGDGSTAAHQRRRDRTCGACHACCVHTSIAALAKPLGQPCPHLDEGRPSGKCTAYQDRPPACRGFLCGWRLGLGDEADRPDHLGVMLQPGSSPSGATLLFVELRPGALGSERALVLMAAWADAHPDALRLRRHGESIGRTMDLTFEGEVRAAA